MKRYFIFGFILSCTSVFANIDKAQLKQCAQELIEGELSGRRIEGKAYCLKKNKYKLNFVYPDVYQELDLSNIKYIKIDSIKITEIKLINKELEKYQKVYRYRPCVSKSHFL